MKTKKILSTLMAIAMIFSMLGVVAAVNVSADEYQLVWSDEFDGAGVNPWNWTALKGGYVPNGERHTPSPDNATVHDGSLDIKGECTVIDEDGNPMPAGQVSKYTTNVKSARLEGVGKQAFKYGKVEIKAKLPNACSSWPAFWTCGWDKWGEDPAIGGSNWPACGEIDFMEMMCVNSNNETVAPSGKKNKDKEYEVHLHCGAKDSANNKMYDQPIDPGNIWNLNPAGEQLAAKWHTYGLIWEKDQMQFTMDGQVRITVDTSNEHLLEVAANRLKNRGGTNSDVYKLYKSQLETKGNPFNDFEHYFILSYAIGGLGTENRFYSDEWPQHMLIDYIRVYQKPNSGATHNETLFNYCDKSYNYWYGKGLVKGTDMPQNWIDDPKYGGQKTEEAGVTYASASNTTAPSSSQTQPSSSKTQPSSSQSQGSTSSTKVIDWDVNTNYWKDGSTISTSVADCITVTKASGKNLIGSSNNNLSGYDGLTFSVTPNSGNEKTTLEVQVGDKTVTFPIGSGTTNCTLPFADNGITPTSAMDLYIRATGGDVSNLTISDIYAYIGSSIQKTECTSAPQDTYSLTKFIDWDVNTNYWKENSTISTSVADCITVTKASGKNLISSNNNNLVGYNGLKFSVTPNSGNEKTTLEIQVGDDGSKTATFAIGSGRTNCTLKFADYGITPNSSMHIYIRATGGDASNLTISDIYAYTGTLIPDLTLTMVPGASIRIGNVNGIRFTTTVDKTQLSNLKSKGYTVELGTLIAPADKVDGYLTFDSALKINVPYNADLVDGTIRGSIINIQESNDYNRTSGNIARTFIGRGYAKITKDNVTTIVYSTENSDGRSLAQVASAFKSDSGYSALSADKKALVDRWASFL